MNSRIRYTNDKSEEHNPTIKAFIGTKYYRANDEKEYQIKYYRILGSNDCHGTILCANEVIHTVKGTSDHKIKIALKAKLQELGCEFEQETRGKTDGID